MSLPMMTNPASGNLKPVQRHPLIWFFAVTYAVTWLLWTPLVILGDRIPAPLGFILTLVGSNVPSTVGILIVAALHGKPGVRRLLGRLLKARVGLRWYLAVLTLPLLVPLGVGISILFGGETPVIDRTIVGVLVLLAFSIFPGSALGEELGWRGLALPRLQARHSALAASLIVGGFWGLCHLPLYLIGLETRPLSIFPAFFVSVVAASVICTWMYNGTGGSLLIVVLYHAALNLPLTVFFEPLAGRAAQPFLIYVTLAVVTAAVVVVATGPEHLSRTHRKQMTTP